VRRLRIPDYVAGAFGLALLISLFCPWYKMVDGTVDGWRSLKLIDIWLFITALMAIAIPVVTAAKDSPALPVAMDVITTWIAFVAFWLVLYRLLSVANSAFVTGRSWGLYLAFVAVIGTLAGAYWAMRTEDAPGMRPPPEVRAMPAPPVHDPATPPG
jgi:hypothetical protein